MHDTFRTIQRALEAGNDALFEASRGKLEPEAAAGIQRTRELMTEALAALVRLEAELLRETNWTHQHKSPPLTQTTKR